MIQAQAIIPSLKNLIILLENGAAPFCYYRMLDTASRKISLQSLQKGILFANTNDLSINFIYGDKTPSKRVQELIESTKHIKIVPYALTGEYEQCIPVISEEWRDLTDSMADLNGRNIILRTRRDMLENLPGILEFLVKRSSRINVIIGDIDTFSDDDLQRYHEILSICRSRIVKLYKQGHIPELNILTDRMVLDAMHNCNAGLEHITLAPNGKFYVCPGFYYQDPGDSIGDPISGIDIKNRQLLDIEHAPICSICDAYHCKRCVYLNKKLTLEINTPSRQQCIISHLERNTSRQMLIELANREPFSSMPPLPEIEYLDPFEVVTRKLTPVTQQSAHPQTTNHGDVLNTLGDIEVPSQHGGMSTRLPSSDRARSKDMDTKQLLMRIYDTQLEILRILKHQETPHEE